MLTTGSGWEVEVMNLRRLLTSFAGHGARSQQTLSRVRTLVKKKKKRQRVFQLVFAFFPCAIIVRCRRFAPVNVPVLSRSA